MHKEYEVKLAASKKMLERIEKIPKLLDWDVKGKKVKHLVSHYFDTAKFDLLYHNIAYRLREEDDKKVVTLKGNGILRNNIYIRDELEEPLKNGEDVTDFNFLNEHFSQILEITKGAALREVLLVNNNRHILELKKDRSMIEVALDSLYFVRGKRKIAFNEIELELKEGSEEDLLECASFFRLKFHLALSGASKYEIGLKSFNLIPLL